MCLLFKRSFSSGTLYNLIHPHNCDKLFRQCSQFRATPSCVWVDFCLFFLSLSLLVVQDMKAKVAEASAVDDVNLPSVFISMDRF